MSRGGSSGGAARGNGQVAVGDRLASRLNLRPGGRLALGGRRLVVSGVYHSGIFFEDSGRDRFTTGTRDASVGGNCKWGYAAGSKWTELTTVASSADMPSTVACR